MLVFSLLPPQNAVKYKMWVELTRIRGMGLRVNLFFKNYTVKTFDKIIPDLDIDKLEQAGEELMFRKAWNYIKDIDVNKRNINLYVLSEDSNGNFISCSDTLKNNLKLWLGQNKMIMDTIQIIDAKIFRESIFQSCLCENSLCGRNSCDFVACLEFDA